MVNIRLPGHQVPSTIGDRRARFEPVKIGIGKGRIHAPSGELYVPLLLTAGHGFDKQPAISSPRGIDPALGIFVGASDFSAIAVLVIIGFIITRTHSQIGVLTAHRHTAVHQFACTVVRPAKFQMTGCEIIGGE